MKINYYLIPVLFISLFIGSCGSEPAAPNPETPVKEEGIKVREELKAEDNEPTSIRLDDELSLEERFQAVIFLKGNVVVWTSNADDNGFIEFTKAGRFKMYYQDKPEKYEGDWKFEEETFKMKTDGDDPAWYDVPLTVVDRETMLMSNADIEYKAVKNDE